MEWLRDRKNRLTVSILAAMADSGGRRIQAATVSGCICMVGNHVSGILLFGGKRRQPPKDFLLACGSAGMVI